MPEPAPSAIADNAVSATPMRLDLTAGSFRHYLASVMRKA
jgi:hypothetical protein